MAARRPEPASAPAREPRRRWLVTGNQGNRCEAERLLARLDPGITLEAAAVDLPEIQSLDVHEVLRHKGEEAWRQFRRPLVVEDTSLELLALNGFPGPLVRWLLAAVGPRGIAELGAALGDLRAVARCVVLLRDRDGFTVGEGTTAGELVTEPRGAHGFGWDPVFVPAGGSATYGELDDETKDEIGHRGRAWRALLQALAEREPPGEG